MPGDGTRYAWQTELLLVSWSVDPTWPHLPATKQFGQLGIGSFVDSNTPEVVSTLVDMNEHICLLACGWKHTLAVAASGKTYAWGRGTNGQLGTGNQGDQNVPQCVELLSKGSIHPRELQGLANKVQGMFLWCVLW